MKGIVTEKEGEREECLYVLVHFPNGWADLKTKTRKFFQVSLTDAGTNTLVPSFAAFPGLSARRQIKSGATETQTGIAVSGFTC